MVSMQNDIGNGRRMDESNIQDKHGPNCFLQYYHAHK